MTALLVFVAAGLITFAMRGAFLLFGDRLTLPGWTRSPLRYVAPAAFAAIAAPATLGDDGFASFAPPTAEVLGIAAAIVIVGRTRNVPACLVGGLVVLWAAGVAGL